MLKKIGKKVLPKLKSRCTYVDLTSYIWLATIQEYNWKKKKVPMVSRCVVSNRVCPY